MENRNLNRHFLHILILRLSESSVNLGEFEITRLDEMRFGISGEQVICGSKHGVDIVRFSGKKCT